jgi:inosine-uridine nucleoside N-ribohydrolase
MKAEEKVKNVLIDTDLGCDCDDAGALAVAINLARSGFCSLAALTNARSSRNTDISIKVILDYFSMIEIPIGRTSRQDFLCEEIYERFTRPLAEKAMITGAGKGLPENKDAVRMMREILVKSPSKAITVVALGPLVNLADLLHSGPDDLSSLGGAELIEQKVSSAWIMGGSTQPWFAEWNFAQDSAAAAEVLKHWPSDIYLLPFESGSDIKTGKRLLQEGRDDNPVKISYQLFNGGTVRESWDPLTVWAAVMGTEPYFTLTKPCEVEVLADGSCVIQKKRNGKCRFLLPRQSETEKLTELLDQWMVL